ncbi:glycosyltransferase [Crenalkalicoccus roseus]|uniref:glycosyltransferase n=1 Tax=Crenalkalicoccus roseus TaxID=1485588 RepID=UPI0010817B9F|nr:glycosyltransferase [Crenalkalicoccus roseus]
MDAASPLRVLHIIPALQQGGAERLLAELVTRAGEGLTHSVLTLTGDRPFFDLGETPVTSLGLRRGQVSPAALRRAAATLRAARPEVVHAWLYHGNLLASLLPRGGAPLLWSIHNTSLPPGGARPMTRAVNRICALLSHRSPWRIVYCAEAARRLHEQAFGYDRKRGVVVENGVDFRAFAFDPARRAALRAAWGLGPEALAIGCVGRFDPQKDHATVIAAFARLEEPRARLVLAGQGCDAANPVLAALLRRAGAEGRALRLGAVAEMPGLLSALDLLVIGSAFGEAMPMVGLEAVAAELPVVATTVGAVARLVPDPAHLAPPRDPAALAAAMAAALRRAGPRPGPATAALRERLRPAHDIAATVAAYHALYRAAAARGRG